MPFTYFKFYIIDFWLGCEKSAVSAALMGFITELQKYCAIQSNDFLRTHTMVLTILDR